MKINYNKLSEKEITQDLYDYLKREWKGITSISNNSIMGFHSLIDETVNYAQEKSDFWFYERALDETYDLWERKRLENKYTSSLSTIKKVNNIKEIYEEITKIYNTEKENWEESLYINAVINSLKENYNISDLKPKGWEEFHSKYKNIEQIKNYIIKDKANKNLNFFGGIELPTKPPFQQHVSIGYVSYNNIIKNKPPYIMLIEGVTYYAIAAKKLKNTTEYIKKIRTIDENFKDLSAVEIKKNFEDLFNYQYKKLKIEEDKQKNELKSVLNKFIKK